MAWTLLSLVNAVPTSGKRLSNDGTNGRAAKRSRAARDAYWNQFEYMALLTEGTRPRDMPEELFFLPEERDLDSALTVCEGMMYMTGWKIPTIMRARATPRAIF